MPIAGACVWLAIAIISTQFDERTGVLILLFGSGAIFPLALAIARVRGEALISSDNPLAKLMGLCVLMVNLLWAVHIPLFLYAPTFVPLSLGVGLGLHWVVWSWIVQHPLGIVHAVLRTILVAVAWFTFPENRLLAIGLVIVFVYGISIWQMLTRSYTTHITSRSNPTPKSGAV
ncbi:hypothetical protein CZ797_04970 [Pseudoalteromonas sp. JB197]|nr:hypothetical protein CZ797_04970 [Pseudoalteromonas sp. JB197]